MAKSKQNIGATLSLKDGGFFANIKSAQRESDNLKDSLGDATGETSNFSAGLESIGGGVVTAVKGIASVTAAVVGVTAAIGGMALAVGQDYTSASNSFAAQTGITGDQLTDLNDVMKDIYSENYGESFEDIADAMAKVTQNSDRINADSIKEMTEDAILLRDTFDFDVQESINAANMLMDQFGLSGDEAMTLVAQGVQQGLNKNGDLLDSINEYSVQFKQSGLEAENMFNMLANGAAGGAFSIDKLGDAVKELGIKIKDGTADDAIIQLGLSAEETKKAFAEGGEAGQKAFEDVNDALFSLDDKVQQNLIGTQLYGTMWEDLGAEGVQALSDINGEFDRTADTLEEIKNIKYDDLGSALEGLKRTLSVDFLLPIGEQLTPAVSDLVNELSNSASGTALEDIAEQLGSDMADIISSVSEDLPYALNAIKQFFDDIAPSISDFKNSVSDMGDTISDSISTDNFDSLASYPSDVVNNIVGGISNVIDAISPLIGTIVGFFNDNIDNFSQFAETGIDIISTVIDIAASLLGPMLEGISKSIGPILDDLGGMFELIKITLDFLQPVFEFIGAGIGGLAEAGTSAVGLMLSILTGDLSGMKENILGIFDGLFGGMVEPVSNTMQTIGSSISSTWENMKTGFSNACESVKTTVITAFDKVKNTIINTFEGVRTSVSDIFDRISTKISDVWESIKGFFKIPSIKQTGTKSILGVDIPTFGIEWNAQGGIMTRPTIFGAVNNVLQGGGEAGPEAILPLSKFWDNLERYIYGAISTPVPAQANTTNHINITVYGGNMDNESIAKEIATKVKQALNNM